MRGSGLVVFWDFDGTLARRDGRWSGALAEAWKLTGGVPEISPAELRPFLEAGFPWHTAAVVRAPQTAEDWWQALLPVFVTAYTSAGAERDEAETAAQLVSTTFYRVDAWTLIDGSLEALGVTKASGYRNVILSNHAPELLGLVNALGLAPLVDLTITSATVGAEKPHRAIFEHALQAVGVERTEDVWMVGDDPTADVEGALAVGMRALLADGVYPDSVGMTVLDAALHIRDQAEHLSR